MGGAIRTPPIWRNHQVVGPGATVGRRPAGPDAAKLRPAPGAAKLPSAKGACCAESAALRSSLSSPAPTEPLMAARMNPVAGKVRLAARQFPVGGGPQRCRAVRPAPRPLVISGCWPDSHPSPLRAGFNPGGVTIRLGETDTGRDPVIVPDGSKISTARRPARGFMGAPLHHAEVPPRRLAPAASRI